MKYYSSGITDLIEKIRQNKIRSLLLHGTNEGFAIELISKIAKKLDFVIRNVEFTDITANELNLIANNQNFFNQKELIKINNIKTTINKEMKELLTRSKYDHFLCFFSNNSLPNSGVRKFFEEDNNLASIGCYYDDEQAIKRLILAQCKINKKTIDQDALFYLTSEIQGDYKILKLELEKLFYFVHDEENITIDHILKIISPNLLTSGDKMCISFLHKKPKDFLQEAEKLKAQNINEILILRIIMRYYLNLYKVIIRLENGDSLDYSIKSLSPPIFFKYINQFKQIVKLYNKRDIVKYIDTLQELEIRYKTHPGSCNLFLIYMKCHKSTSCP